MPGSRGSNAGSPYRKKGRPSKAEKERIEQMIKNDDLTSRGGRPTGRNGIEANGDIHTETIVSIENNVDEVMNEEYPSEDDEEEYVLEDEDVECEEDELDKIPLFYNEHDYQEIKTNIAENIKELRKINNLSREALGWKVDLTRQYIGQIENNDKNITIENLTKIATAFGVDVEYLMNSRENDTEEMRKFISLLKVLPHDKHRTLLRSMQNLIRKLMEEDNG